MDERIMTGFSDIVCVRAHCTWAYLHLCRDWVGKLPPLGCQDTYIRTYIQNCNIIMWDNYDVNVCC